MLIDNLVDNSIFLKKANHGHKANLKFQSVKFCNTDLVYFDLILLKMYQFGEHYLVYNVNVCIFTLSDLYKSF